MLDRYDNILSEKYRRQDEYRYAGTHNLAKKSGLQVSYYRNLVCRTLIQSGEYLIAAGRKFQPKIDGTSRPLVARMK